MERLRLRRPGAAPDKTQGASRRSTARLELLATTMMKSKNLKI